RWMRSSPPPSPTAAAAKPLTRHHSLRPPALRLPALGTAGINDALLNSGPPEGSALRTALGQGLESTNAVTCA
ncbi:MAG: hypothetical protein ACREIV_05815, partial [Planctomycetaceae bacterium]